MKNCERLWKYIAASGEDRIIMSFDEIAEICSEELDHSFLNHKKELFAYGYTVGKISIKAKNVFFEKLLPSGKENKK